MLPLGHPQRIDKLTMGSTASTSYVCQKLTWHILISYDLNINRFKVVPGGSRCSRTPSTTSSSSTMASIASTSNVHQYLTWHMVIYYFSKTNRFKMVPASFRVIKMLSDTFSEFLKLNHDNCCTCHG